MSSPRADQFRDRGASGSTAGVDGASNPVTPAPEVWTEENYEREAIDRSVETCISCGAGVAWPEGTPWGPCPMCGFVGEERVTYVIAPALGDKCPDCGVARGQRGYSHYPTCPKSVAMTERFLARQRHPSNPKPLRGPHRVIGDRIWSDIEERWTTRGEEFGP